MAISVQQRGKRFQLRVTHKLLPQAFFFTFDDEDAARAYGQQLLSLLQRGHVPAELLVPEKAGDDPLVTKVVREYLKSAANLTPSDDALLSTMLGELALLRMSGLTYSWAESYVGSLKLVHNYTPGTIRKRVGALARVIDWRIRTLELKNAINPLRLLPSGYSQYTERDQKALKEGQAVRVDVERDRRLYPGEEPRIVAALRAEDAELELLYFILADSGLRLREAYRLRVEHFHPAAGVLEIDGSKVARGQRKPRMVPLKPALRQRLAAHCMDRVGRMFSFWDGDPATLDATTSRLSYLFRKAFRAAGCEDLDAHDLRHEAACRWFEHRTGAGWTFNEVEISKIMGWKDTRMCLRYASLRGEDLARRLG